MSSPDPPRRHSLLYYILSAISGAALGAVPGTLIAFYGTLRPGCAVILIGIPIGIVFSLRLADPGRTARLFASTVVARNMPTAREAAMNWADAGAPPTEEQEDASQRLIRWLFPAEIGDKRARWVVCAILVAVGSVILISIHDYVAMIRGGSSWLIPSGSRNLGDFLGAVLGYTLGAGTWTAGLVGIFASRAFRRPILFGVLVAGYLGACIELAIDTGNASHSRVSPGFLTFVGMSVALFIALFCAFVGLEPPEQRDSLASQHDDHSQSA
jgi:hypothetical protein